MTTYYEVKISAENSAQAKAILNTLLAKKLATGGQIIEAPAHFLWKGEVNNMPHYCTIWSYTTEQHKQAIIAEVKKVSVEEVPMIWFTVIDGNPELLDWIDNTLGGKP
ncbi:MAG TPA: divalent cation tolerance protein CutA [Candidatus Saccharimonadales bacterium]|nr:divalent cation tolerance protein CutA [Candidatus Saccharimonadales bacterium]